MVITRNRRLELLASLERHAARHPDVPVVVVDNASADGTVSAVRACLPSVDVVALPYNVGANARTIGVRRAPGPYVAFSDDDSWWATGSLERAGHALDEHPNVAVVTGRTLVGVDEREDPLVDQLSRSPLGRKPGLPGPSVRGFLACTAVVRQRALLSVQGFHPLLGFIGEEQLLAWDLAAAGWELCYLPDVVAHHHPSARRPGVAWRKRREARNGWVSAWMRRRVPSGALPSGSEAVRALPEAMRLLPAAARARRPLPRPVEEEAALLAGFPH